jgi:hypothetical protein
MPFEWTRALVIGLGTAALAGLHAAEAQVAGNSITVPVRKAQSAPLSLGLPELPPAAESISPLVLTVTTRWEEGGRSLRSLRQTVWRTRDRVRVAVEGAESEWLFLRNPVDHRRVTASLIDHRKRRILRYDETDLRNGHGVRGWLDVLTLRADSRAVKALRDTGRRETVAGIEFTEYARDAAPGAERNGIVGVWWSESHLLPRRFSIREGRVLTTSDVQIGREAIDESALAAASVRFPQYAVVDIADAREGGTH